MSLPATENSGISSTNSFETSIKGVNGVKFYRREIKPTAVDTLFSVGSGISAGLTVFTSNVSIGSLPMPQVTSYPILNPDVLPKHALNMMPDGSTATIQPHDPNDSSQPDFEYNYINSSQTAPTYFGAVQNHFTGRNMYTFQMENGTLSQNFQSLIFYKPLGKKVSQGNNMNFVSPGFALSKSSFMPHSN